MPEQQQIGIEDLDARLRKLYANSDYVKVFKQVAKRYASKFTRSIQSEIHRRTGHGRFPSAGLIDTGRMYRGIYTKIMERSLMVGVKAKRKGVDYVSHVETWSAKAKWGGLGFFAQGIENQRMGFLRALEIAAEKKAYDKTKRTFASGSGISKFTSARASKYT